MEAQKDENERPAKIPEGEGRQVVADGVDRALRRFDVDGANGAIFASGACAEASTPSPCAFALGVFVAGK